MRKPKLYFASPLFNEAELAFNEQVAEQMEEAFEVYLPQRDGGLLARMVKTGLPAAIASSRVFLMDIQAIEACDVILAVMDGRAIDEGVAFELGCAFAKGKLCIGLQTDVRRLLPSGNNPMISQSLSRLFHERKDLIAWSNAALTFYLREGSLARFSSREPLVG